MLERAESGVSRATSTESSVKEGGDGDFVGVEGGEKRDDCLSARKEEVERELKLLEETVERLENSRRVGFFHAILDLCFFRFFHAIFFMLFPTRATVHMPRTLPPRARQFFFGFWAAGRESRDVSCRACMPRALEQRVSRGS